MATWDTRGYRGGQRGQLLLRRIGEELHTARMTAGLSSRAVGKLAGISHVQVIRIERGLAPHVDIAVLSKLASILGHELSLRIHPIGPPVRDKAHVALLQRFAARLGPGITWRTEVPDGDTDFVPPEWQPLVADESIVVSVLLQAGDPPTVTARANNHDVVYVPSSEPAPGCD